MTSHQAFRFALDPTLRQRQALASHCGAARFVFNWGLREVKSTLEARKWERLLLGGALTPSDSWTLASLRRRWNESKARAAPWWQEYSKEAYNSGLAALVAALEAWSQARRGERAGEAAAFPHWRKRGRRDSCAFTTGVIRVDDERHLTLPRLGRIRTCESTSKLLRQLEDGSARILRATVSREADRWFVSFGLQVERAHWASNGKSDVLGVDLGVLRLATCSDGSRVAARGALKRSLRRLRRAQRQLARRKRGSAHRQQAAARVARVHRRASNLRREHLHLLTTKLAKNHGCIVIEDLNVRGLTRSARGSLEKPGRRVLAKAGLNRALADASFGQLRRLLEYKTRWYGSRLLVADRYLASSKRCSECGALCQELKLSQRIYRCLECGVVIDRDLNAARNLVWWAQEAQRGTASTAGTGSVDAPYARGEDERSGTAARDALAEAGTGIGPESAGPEPAVLSLGLRYVPC